MITFFDVEYDVIILVACHVCLDNMSLSKQPFSS